MADQHVGQRFRASQREQGLGHHRLKALARHRLGGRFEFAGLADQDRLHGEAQCHGRKSGLFDEECRRLVLGRAEKGDAL